MSNLDAVIAKVIEDLTEENARLKLELIKERREHQEAMQIADQRIRELERRLADYVLMGNYNARPTFEFPDNIQV